MACEKLSSATLNWNAAAGSIAAVSLAADSPAINLHTYKFYFARAIRFIVQHAGRELRPESVEVRWFPHKLYSRIAYPHLTLDLEAMFLDEQTIACRHRLAADRALDVGLIVLGNARNGTSRDGYFRHRGRVVAVEDGCVVQQEVDIPDYRTHPIGPARRHTHTHVWVVAADAPIHVSREEIEHAHPERIRLEDNEHEVGTNRSNYWRLEKRLTLRPLQPAEGRLFIGTRWLGPQRAAAQDLTELRQAIRTWQGRPAEEAEQGLIAGWDALLRDVPPMKERYRGDAEYLDLYHKAWVCIFQNVCGTLATTRKTIRGPSALVGKACYSGFGPAQWETSLAGYLISFVRPDLGVGIIESVLNSAEIDGFIPEDLLFNRDVKLSSYEPLMLEGIHRRTGRTDFLERNYDNALRQLAFHLKHPCFYYLDSRPGFARLDNYYSLLALRRIAETIGKGPEELQFLDGEIADAEAALAEMMEGQDTGSSACAAVYGWWDKSEARGGVEFIRDRLVPPEGLHFLYARPDGGREGNHAPNALKMNGYLLLISGLERLGEEDLLDTIVSRTLSGLRTNGDFWECYYVDGRPWGNGPMSIFGAFGWIWSVMAKRPAARP